MGMRYGQLTERLPTNWARFFQKTFNLMMSPIRPPNLVSFIKIKPAKIRKTLDTQGFKWWAVEGSNFRPPPCQGGALPLS